MEIWQNHELKTCFDQKTIDTANQNFSLAKKIYKERGENRGNLLSHGM